MNNNQYSNSDFKGTQLPPLRPEPIYKRSAVMQSGYSLEPEEEAATHESSSSQEQWLQRNEEGGYEDENEEEEQQVSTPVRRRRQLVVCNICNIAIIKDNITRHTEEIHVGTICYFPSCHVVTATENDLRQHLKGHVIIGNASNSDHPFSCQWPGCDKTFNQFKAARRHQLRHNSNAKLAAENGPSDTQTLALTGVPIPQDHWRNQLDLALDIRSRGINNDEA
ncbi:hypothetical protein F5X99DRAFT_404403 [Biscogniauxia marginata]|nr:hypothetical protein F5X99DRAFT_404403 [Biscogniauxia marginata]